MLDHNQPVIQPPPENSAAATTTNLDHHKLQEEEGPSRRQFMGTSAAVSATALAAGSLVGPGTQPAYGYHQAVNDTVKIGLVGCGGRGRSALKNALKADNRVVITALADAFGDQIESCKETIARGNFADRLQVKNDHMFTDFDCYQKIMETDIDVVLLCSPPHFRPMQMEAAVAAGKHIFCEKPIATDAPGVRRVMQASQLAEQHGLNLVSGLCWRYDLGVNATMDQIKNGAIGEIQAIHSNYLTGELWFRNPQDSWSDMEYQCRNWLYYNWLSGDLINEQHIHTIDKGLWLMDDVPPASCYGMGGRQKRIDSKWGNVYDHFTTVYQWGEMDRGVKMFSLCRQMNECFSQNECFVVGTKGTAMMLKHVILNEDGQWRYEERKPSMYDVEHQELFKAIRGERPTINNGLYMCQSTLAALMGRNASYTGKQISWEEAWEDESRLGPDEYRWGDYDAGPVPVPGSGRT